MEQVILVVEDEPLIGMEIQEQLERSGFLVPLVAQSGEEAISSIRQIVPDLIMLDIRLAGSIDGIETASQIRARYDIPIIYLTAFSDQTTVIRAGNTEPDAYLVKPFNERELLANINITLLKQNKKRSCNSILTQYAAVIDTLNDPALIFDSEGTIFHLNLSAMRTLGIPNEQGFSGNTLHNLVGIYENNLRGIVSKSYSLLPSIVNNDKDIKFLRIEALLDSTGSIRAYTGLLEKKSHSFNTFKINTTVPGIQIQQNESDHYGFIDSFEVDNDIVALYRLNHSELDIDREMLQNIFLESFRECIRDTVEDAGCMTAPTLILSRLTERFVSGSRGLLDYQIIVLLINLKTREWFFSNLRESDCIIESAGGAFHVVEDRNISEYEKVVGKTSYGILELGTELSFRFSKQEHSNSKSVEVQKTASGTNYQNFTISMASENKGIQVLFNRPTNPWAG